MTGSPFLRVAPEAWIASNEYAFAVFDARPVAEGHALLVPWRVVPTWFEASRTEQLAILDLVER